MEALPLVYAFVIVAEVLGLGWLYAHDAPAPSDALSVGLGWGAIASMVVMLIYSFARRSRALRQVARLSFWLHFHIFLGVQGVVFALFHSAHLVLRSVPINFLNPAVINLFAVLVVFFSGIFGRYLYSFLPKTIGGDRMAAKEIEAELAKLDVKVPDEVTALWKGAGAAEGMVALVRADWATRAAVRRLNHLSLAPEIVVLAERRLRLERRLAAYAGAERVFRRWIILHRPLASIMYILTIVHITLSYMFSPSLGK